MNNAKKKIYRFLKWLEKWTKTDMIYLAKGGFWMSIGQVSTITTGIIASIAFANLLPMEVFGQYKFILSIFGILTIFSLSGMASATIQAVSRGYEQTYLVIQKTKLKWGLIGTLICFIISAYYYTNDNNSLAISFVIIGVLSPFLNAYSSYGSFLNGKKLFKLSTILSSSTTIILTAITVITLFFTKNIIIIILCIFASKTILNLIAYSYTILKQKPNKKIDAQAINFGKHLSLMEAFSVVTTHIDKILIWHFIGTSELAIYSMATLPVSYIKSFFTKWVTNLALPKLANSSKETIANHFPLKVIKFTAISTITSILYIIAAPLIFRLIFPLYLESVFYTQLLALTIAITPLGLFNSILLAHKQHKKLYQASISTSIIQIISYIILLPLLSMTGMVLAIIFTQIFNAAILIFLSKKYLKE